MIRRLREQSVLICCGERAWHDITCAGYRVAWDVYMTCVSRVHNREHAAGARTRVNTAR